MPLSPKGTHNNWNAISFAVYMIMCDPFGVGVWGMSPTAGQDLRLGTCDPFGVNAASLPPLTPPSRRRGLQKDKD